MDFCILHCITSVPQHLSLTTGWAVFGVRCWSCVSYVARFNGGPSTPLIGADDGAESEPRLLMKKTCVHFVSRGALCHLLQKNISIMSTRMSLDSRPCQSLLRCPTSSQRPPSNTGCGSIFIESYIPGKSAGEQLPDVDQADPVNTMDPSLPGYRGLLLAGSHAPIMFRGRTHPDR